VGALDLLFPKRCVSCRKIGDYVCTNCFSFISFTTTPRCLVCGNPCLDGFTHPACQGKYRIDGCFSGVCYKGVVKKLLYTFKYKPYLSSLTEFLGGLLHESLIQNETYIRLCEAYEPIFVPIPLSSRKLRERGYNQAELLARELAQVENGKVQSVLVRMLQTKPQYGLSREERMENIKGAFSYRHSGKQSASRINGRSWTSQDDSSKIAFLVDDVVTTGSTLMEAANVLKRNGFTKVWGVTLAQD